MKNSNSIHAVHGWYLEMFRKAGLNPNRCLVSNNRWTYTGVAWKCCYTPWPADSFLAKAPKDLGARNVLMQIIDGDGTVIAEFRKKSNWLYWDFIENWFVTANTTQLPIIPSKLSVKFAPWLQAAISQVTKDAVDKNGFTICETFIPLPAECKTMQLIALSKKAPAVLVLGKLTIPQLHVLVAQTIGNSGKVMEEETCIRITVPENKFGLLMGEGAATKRALEQAVGSRLRIEKVPQVHQQARA